MDETGNTLLLRGTQINCLKIEEARIASDHAPSMHLAFRYLTRCMQIHK